MPAVVVETIPQHQEFIDWWRRQCEERNIPYLYRVAEPMGHRIITAMLKKRTLSELKSIAIQLFRDHGDKLREEDRHFMLFAGLADKVETEMADRV